MDNFILIKKLEIIQVRLIKPQPGDIEDAETKIQILIDNLKAEDSQRSSLHEVNG